jgi:hypothetical protein
VTSLEKLAGRAVPMPEVEDAAAAAFAEVFDCSISNTEGSRQPAAGSRP